MDAPCPDDYQPPLRWYSQVWRYLVALAIGLFTWLPVVEKQAEADRPWLFWLDIIAGVVAFVLVAWRRRWPLGIAIAVTLLTPITSVGAGAIVLAVVSLATRREWWQVVAIGLLNLAGSAGYQALQPAPDDPVWLIATSSLVATAAILAWGMYVGSRRELLWTLRQRAEEAEAERDLRAGQARTNERSRIAREMHDVLAHRISQISLHAGALTYREDLSADEMRSSVAVIQAKAHEALNDLREVLGVLREETAAVPTGPQPTQDQLITLVEEARASGTTITYVDTLPADPALPDAIARTVYRTIQEGITNASKHAPAATLHITLAGSPEVGVEVSLRNPIGFGPSRTPGARLGLVGLTERVELSNGHLSHGLESPGPAGGRTEFVLHAWLPWTPELEEDHG